MVLQGLHTRVHLSKSQGVPGLGLSGTRFAKARARNLCGTNEPSTQEGRTHMLQEHKHWSVVSGLLAVALLAACNKDAASPDRSTRAGPGFKGVTGCTPGKWTGGGRIDPPNNPDATDETDLGMSLPAMTGKVTFGFNVFLGTDCIVTKGEIEVSGHDILVNGQTFKLAWHVSIHDRVDAFSGQHVFAETFTDGSLRGTCLVVGLPSMTARVNPQGGTEQVQFEVCDNDRGKPQNSRADAMRWRTANHGDTGPTFLTGGNVVDHS